MLLAWWVAAATLAIFCFLTLPHLARPIAVVVMVEAIFLLNIFAEIFTTTSGGPGDATTNVPFLIFTQAASRVWMIYIKQPIRRPRQA